MIGVNYLDLNMNVEVPPEFWLQRLFDFDSKLVVFPSRVIPFAYVLARRAERSRGLTDQALIDTIEQLDTKTCLLRGLVPVTIIYRVGSTWSIDNIIRDLHARDTWRWKDSDALADQLDADDAEAERKKRQAIRDDMWNRSGDAWRSYQSRTGASSIQFGARQEKRAPDSA
jgi:hypothetical protein